MQFPEIEKIKQLDGFDIDFIESLRETSFKNDDVYELLRVITLCFRWTGANTGTFAGGKFDAKVLQDAMVAFAFVATDRETEQ